MRYAGSLLILAAGLAGAWNVSPVPAGSPPPEGIYLGLSGGYELYLTRATLPGAVEIGDSDAPLYLVSSIEGPVRLPDVVLVHGFLPDGSAVCRLTREEIFRLCGDPNLYFRELMPVVRAPERPTPAGFFTVQGGLTDELVEEVDLASIMAFDEDLAAFRTRYATSDGNFQAQDYLAFLLEEYGYEVERESAFFGDLYHLSADGDLIAMAGGTTFFDIGGCFFSVDSGEDFAFYRPTRDVQSVGLGGVQVFSPDVIHYASDKSYCRSTDGGDTWTETELLDDELDRIFFMYFADESTGYIFAISGQVYRTSDGGSSWELRGTMPSQAVAAASPVGKADVVIASTGNGRILRSADGGVNWERVYLDDFWDACFAFAFEDGERGLGVGDWVFATDDGGLTWERVENPNADAVHIAVSSVGPGEYIVCTEDAAYYTDDGGGSWEDYRIGGYTYDYSISDMEYRDGRMWFLTLQYPGYTDDLNQDCTWLREWYTGLTEGPVLTNIIGERLGTLRPDEYVYATAHYDSISGDSDPMELAPGADDNGSGSTALLELARVLAPYENRRTLRFAFFDAEEWGLLGSQHHVNRLAADGCDVLCDINLDMVVWSDDPEVQEDLEVIGRYRDEWLVDLVIEDCDRYGDGLTWVKWLNGSGASDHQSFWNAGYNAIEGIEDSPITYPYYHSKDDDYPNIEDHFPFTRQVTRATAGALARLIGLVKPPEGEGPVGTYAYPNPFRGAEHDAVTFANLTPHTEISVFDAGGARVFQATADGSDFIWEVVNSSGLALASGIYLYLLKTPDGAVTTGKLAVIR
ncbi:MAG TPA: M28 family peptidase [bacterium]|nr:M28 family peptidase [bacterium]